MLAVPDMGLQGLYIGSSPERSPVPSPPGSPRTQESCGIAPLTPSQSPKPEARAPQHAPFSVVVAIDFGTTSSGYAFSFASDPEAIHMMRKWEGGDPGVAHQKTPTCLLLTPEGAFHSFGYTARDYYHDLDPEEARDWLYFEKFKMKIHSATVRLILSRGRSSRGGGARSAKGGAHGAEVKCAEKLRGRSLGSRWRRGWGGEVRIRGEAGLSRGAGDRTNVGLARTLQRGSSRKWGDFQREVVRKWGQSYGFLQNCLCPCQDLTLKTQLEAVNGKKMPALEVFAHALRFFKEHALQELREQCPSLPEKDTVRWVLTVPAIWKQPAKQFMREAAYLAGLVSREDAGQLLIALEPEAASVYCRKLRLHQLLDLSSRAPGGGRLGERRSIDSSFRQAREQLRRSRHSRTFLVESGVGELWAEMQAGDRYVVADCGGGTVDLTVHQLEQPHGTLKELYKASGGPYGAVGVDLAFEQLLGRIFGEDFITTFKRQRPAAWVDLTIAFEARKRTAGPHRAGALNISLPFSFIDFYRKQRGHNVETALRRSSVNFVKWSSQGMLRMSCEAMNELFQPTVSGIIQHIEALLARPEVQGVKLLFLVGGFAESAVLQHAVQTALGARGLRVVVPHDVGLTILKGAVLFGQAPGVVRVRRSPLTYGVGVLNRFVAGRHPPEKLLVRDGRRWCTDVFERFVAAEQSVALGEEVRRSYCPARPGQRRVLINLYCCAAEDARFITDPGVRKCGALSLELEPSDGASPGRREIRAAMQFGDTEIKVTAVDVSTNRSVRAAIDFLSN
ncbi:heat shock 70 kDa protein 12B isoform X2 [Ailuropoda melanoleuca]|uniref:Heat shock protein family A (Hsp70) member 12B n=1 Tax=Ailuropoda melanoleuca TaxID=9646 RepID=A0A7N5JQQ6_AILME|nr:heat shock 70 kDa protein 12B isoform X2 [Ailuropoda melanoleuca]